MLPKQALSRMMRSIFLKVKQRPSCKFKKPKYFKK